MQHGGEHARQREPGVCLPRGGRAGRLGVRGGAGGCQIRAMAGPTLCRDLQAL